MENILLYAVVRKTITLLSLIEREERRYKTTANNRQLFCTVILL